MEKLSLGGLLKVICLIISIKKVDLPMVDEDKKSILLHVLLCLKVTFFLYEHVLIYSDWLLTITFYFIYL